MIILSHIKRLLAWLRAARHPVATNLPVAIFPVPSGGSISSLQVAPTCPKVCCDCHYLGRVGIVVVNGYHYQRTYCAVHPFGPESNDTCPDYRVLPTRDNQSSI